MQKAQYEMPPTFAEAVLKRHRLRCPKCGEHVLCVHGSGWDYDLLWCSAYGCDWEHEYESTSYLDDF